MTDQVASMNVGVVELSVQELLALLQFQGGTLLGVEHSVGTGTMRLRIAHPVFPAVLDGQGVAPQNLCFDVIRYGCGHSSKLRRMFQAVGE